MSTKKVYHPCGEKTVRKGTKRGSITNKSSCEQILSNTNLNQSQICCECNGFIRAYNYKSNKFRKNIRAGSARPPRN